MRERQMEKMTERKRDTEEEGLQLQSCHVRPVSNLIFFFFFFPNVCTCTRIYKCMGSIKVVPLQWLRLILGPLGYFMPSFSFGLEKKKKISYIFFCEKSV